ncbi:MAG: gluconate 2-dehydrogenase subunit 3 family protein [Thermomicrobiales bacterium]
MPHDDPESTRNFIPRRRFLRGSALLALGAATVPNRGLAAGVAPEHLEQWMALFQNATPISLETYTPVSLTADEFETIGAAVDRLIPPDETGPGAADAGVHLFIDRSLKGPNAAMLPLYQAGAAALDASAGTGGFSAAASDKQDQMLSDAEAGKLADAPDGFFGLLLEHTRQGMFGDPVYGGNINFAGWDLIGYPGMKLLWSAEEQEVDVIVTPEHISVAKYGGTGW